ncbi:MAG: endolytic transglycosylase MltG, partial [Bacteroidota bacterium]
SPYNTYKYTGLPPGPISMASISSIDAVLNNEAHDYIFFCAKGDGSGYHAFAKTLAGHNANAARYRKNLRARGLR